MDERELERLKETFHIEEQEGPRGEQGHDEIDSLYGLENGSHVSKGRSIKSSATYISKLEKELNEERTARKKLEQDIAELKKISSELSSQLGLKK